MSTTVRTKTAIRCTPEDLFRYIQQPWRWHDWHPNSKGAVASNIPLTPGDTFDEEFHIKPFTSLPIVMKRDLHWTVLTEEPFTFWDIEARTNDASIQITYNFEETADGVLFTRTVKYNVTGWAAIMTSLLAKRNQELSEEAMHNLKDCMETGRFRQAA